MKVNNNNPCSGVFGNCIDVKITSKCNGVCKFCIANSDDHLTDIDDVDYLIAQTLSLKDYPNVLILGGEPLLYHHIEEYVTEISKHKNVFLTTNGSLLHWNQSRWLQYLKGLNISIHHYNTLINKKITGVMVNIFNISSLVDKLLSFPALDIRLNCCCLKGQIDSYEKMFTYLEFAKSLGINYVKFSELQTKSPYYVNMSKIIESEDYEPFQDGCSKLYRIDNVTVEMRYACGLLQDDKPKVENPQGKKGTTKIIMNNGDIVDEWGGLNESIQCHSSGCH